MTVATPFVGVVSTNGCPHCKRAKGSLASLGVDFTEAQLGEALDLLAKVKETTGQATVPQVRLKSAFAIHSVHPFGLYAGDI